MEQRLSPEDVTNAVRAVPLTISAGCNKGLLWSVAAAQWGFGDGTFEPSRVASIGSLIQPDDCVWDIGAHRGYVSLYASRLVGPAGCVYACEPSEKNLWFLRQHLAWNNAGNVEVVPYAVADTEGQSSFGFFVDMSLCYQLGKGNEVVTVRSVRSLIEDDGLRPPTFMKIDAECAEARILEGAGRYLDNPGMLICLSYHSLDLYRKCCELLAGFGYRVVLPDYAIDFDPAGRADVDLLAIGRGRHVPPGLIDQFKSITPYA
jgi:FkbM family methyltransferase